MIEILGKLKEDISYEITLNDVLDGIDNTLKRDKPGYMIDRSTVNLVKGRKENSTVNITMKIVRDERIPESQTR